MHALHASTHVNVMKDEANQAMLMPKPYDGANDWVQIMVSKKVQRSRGSPNSSWCGGSLCTTLSANLCHKDNTEMQSIPAGAEDEADKILF